MVASWKKKVKPLIVVYMNQLIRVSISEYSISIVKRGLNTIHFQYLCNNIDTVWKDVRDGLVYWCTGSDLSFKVLLAKIILITGPNYESNKHVCHKIMANTKWVERASGCL